MKSLGLVPIRNFACVSSKYGLYRSAQPIQEYEYDWLKKVAGIDIIVNLRSELNHDKKHAVKHGITVKNFNIKDHCEPTLKQACDFIAFVMLAVKNGKKVLFHCEHGHGRTSTFCVLARLAIGWELERALLEEKNRFHYNFKHAAQIEFLRKHFKGINHITKLIRA